VAKICDFIVAKVVLPESSDKKLTAYPGSIAFMPPEVFTSDCDYGLPIDRYFLLWMHSLPCDIPAIS